MKRLSKLIVAMVPVVGTALFLNGLAPGAASAADINLGQAVAVVTAAVDRATAIGIPMDVAVVDRGGRLRTFVRMDGAWLGSVDIAQAKAFTATAFCRDDGSGCFNTQGLKGAVQPGADLFGLQSTNRKDGIVAFDGGVTLCSGGVPFGAIGVSGGSIAQDQDVARTAAVNSGMLCAGQ